MSRLLLLAFALTLVACGSPEAQRSRGGGPGADTGNRSQDVRMHEGSEQFHRTPHLVTGEGAPVDTSNHARELSL